MSAVRLRATSLHAYGYCSPYALQSGQFASMVAKRWVHPILLLHSTAVTGHTQKRRFRTTVAQRILGSPASNAFNCTKLDGACGLQFTLARYVSTAEAAWLSPRSSRPCSDSSSSQEENCNASKGAHGPYLLLRRAFSSLKRTRRELSCTAKSIDSHMRIGVSSPGWVTWVLSQIGYFCSMLLAVFS